MCTDVSCVLKGFPFGVVVQLRFRLERPGYEGSANPFVDKYLSVETVKHQPLPVCKIQHGLLRTE